jgi:hypothetical protein
VQGEVDKLEKLSSPREPESPSEAMRRPHRCVVVWGERGMPALRCVIEALAVKYVMFADDGRPLRAVCTVKMREIDIARMWKEKTDIQDRDAQQRAGRFAAAR